MMPPLRVGFVGASFIAKFQLRAMAWICNMESAGVTSRTRAHAEEVVALARQLGVGEAKVYASISEMAPHVDAIAMIEEIVAAVKAGALLKGIICEKPLGRNVAGALQLVELAEEAKLSTAYFENQVFMKPLRAQLAQLAPQIATMGTPLLARAAEEHGGPHEPWFWDPTRQGGCALLMDGMGPGYAFEINTLASSSQLFIGDAAAEAIADTETALEKATVSRGRLTLHYNEADLYGYTDENADAATAFQAGRAGFLDWRYGLEITKLVTAAYMAAEQRRTIDLTDMATQQALESYIPLIQQGSGAEILF